MVKKLNCCFKTKNFSCPRWNKKWW